MGELHRITWYMRPSSTCQTPEYAKWNKPFRLVTWWDQGNVKGFTHTRRSGWPVQPSGLAPPALRRTSPSRRGGPWASSGR
eukprot:scaffold1573_cov125-Isochrysis_galbana.AAC.5